MSKILEFLADRLSSGRLVIGQVLISEAWRLCHVDDEAKPSLQTFHDPEAAHKISIWTDENQYRPLKTAPNLRHGWELRLDALSEVRLALDLLYPAALGKALALHEGRLEPTPLRTFLARQTGMYAITKKLTNQQAAEVTTACCHRATRCLNCILWPIEPGSPSPYTLSPKEILNSEPVPLICIEPCSLFLGAARAAAKGKPAEGSED